MEQEKHFIDDVPFESKMIILYLIDKMGLPMPLSGIQMFILSTNFMDFFSLSQYMAELVETGHLKIIDEKYKNERTYEITKLGEESVEFFKGHISDYAKIRVSKFVKENKPKLRDGLALYSSFKAHDIDSYEVVCGAKEKNEIIFEVKINVSSAEYAKKICSNWEKKHTQCYLNIINELLDTK